MSEQMPDLDVARAKRHAEKEQEFGSKPFKFGGEVFYVRANVGYTGIKRVASLSENSSGGETFGAIESSIFTMIDPKDGSFERMQRVLANEDDPVTFEDLIDLQSFLIGETTNRPPTQDAPSAATPSLPGTSSTEASSTGQGEAPTI
jgi:hypothetical protein